MGRKRQLIIIRLLLAAAVLASCSRHKAIDRNAMRSEIKSAVSLAAESEMFIDYVRQRRSTRAYAMGHAVYLEKIVNQSLKELHQAIPGPDTANAYRECQTQLDLLRHELSAIPAALGRDDAMAAAGQRIGNARERLEKAGSSL